VQEAIQKAAVLIEALPYIQAFEASRFVVKLGGSAMKDEQALISTLTDIVFLHKVGIRPVIVHGGGHYISEAMERSGIKPRFVAGQRYTDEAALAIVEEVLVGQVNAGIVEKIGTLGSPAEGLHPKNGNVLFAEKYSVGESSEPQDIGYVGRVVKVDTGPILKVISEGQIPVIAPIASDASGQALNCNADNVAFRVAEALSARKLVFLSDVPGILQDPGDEKTLISTLTRSKIDSLISDGRISGGMLPKVRESLEAIEAGVKKVHIIDGRMPHSLLLEIFTRGGVGTEIVG